MSELARLLRKRQTDAERLLWRYLRDPQFRGLKFRHQELIGHYVVDFVCFDAKLIVEVDGGQHAEQAAADARRTAYLESLGYRVVRFWNHEVLTNIEGVLAQLDVEIDDIPSPKPSPGGRGHQTQGARKVSSP